MQTQRSIGISPFAIRPSHWNCELWFVQRNPPRL